MLTQRSRYALRAMLFLAEAPAGGPPIPMVRKAMMNEKTAKAVF